MTKPVLAILGAGKLGVTLAQLATKAGYTVSIAGSGSVEKIALSMSVLAPKAIVATASDAVQPADIVMLALPLGKYTTIPKEALRHKVVIDAMNYWWEVDGDKAAIVPEGLSSSELIQQFLPDASVVKAFSHMGYHHLHDEARAKGAAGRKAIAIAGDGSDAVKQVSSLVDALGFDPVTIGSLASGVQLEPHHAAFGANMTAQELKRLFTA